MLAVNLKTEDVVSLEFIPDGVCGLVKGDFIV